MTSPSQRSLAHLRKNGYLPWVVEHFNTWTKRRQDLYGFGDILAIGNGEIVIVQTTTAANMAAREKKILTNPHAHEWVMNGGTIVVHGWAKRGPRGKRKLWTLAERIIVP